MIAASFGAIAGWRLVIADGSVLEYIAMILAVGTTGVVSMWIGWRIRSGSRLIGRHLLLPVAATAVMWLLLLAAIAVSANRTAAPEGPREAPQSRQVLVETPVPVGRGPVGFATGAGALWTLDESGTVTRLSATNSVRRTYVGGPLNQGAVLGGRLWFTAGRYIRALDFRTGRLISIPIHFRASDIAAGFGYVWVTNLTSRAIDRVDPETRDLVPIRLPGRPTSVVAAHGSLWVGLDTGNVVRVDPQARSSPILIRTDLYESVKLADSPDGVWVLASRRGVARLIAAANHRVPIRQRVAVGGGSSAFTYAFDSLWVVKPETDEVQRFQLDTGVVTTVGVRGRPIAIVAFNGRIVVAASQSGRIVPLRP